MIRSQTTIDCRQPQVGSRAAREDATLVGLLLIMLQLSCAATSDAQAPGREPMRVRVLNLQEALIADSGRPTRKSEVRSIPLVFQHEYQPGDHIVVGGPAGMAIRVDDRIPECQVYGADGEFRFSIPFGAGEAATRSAFSQDNFAGASHRITARALTQQEQIGYRNLALNPCDEELQPPAIEGTAAARTPHTFPHASTNSVSRSLPDFRARNAVDGMYQNGHHGMWPFQSWGPELRADLWWKVEFGRLVEIDSLRIMERADFPHDSYWQTAVAEFSDGTTVDLQFKQSSEFQEFPFPRRTVSWVRLTKLVAADPARWCGFVEVEAWGHDLK